MLVRSILAIGAAAALAACAGAGPATSLVPGSPANGQRSTGKITLRIEVPKRAHKQRIRIVRNGRPAFISAATEGMTVAITGPTVIAQTFGLLPSSPGCTGGPGGAVCAISLSGLKPCLNAAPCYTGTVKTYDTVVCSPSCVIPVGANELSAAQNVAFTVVSGKANLVPMVLGGIPTNFTVSPLQPGYLQGDALGLKLWGPNPQELVVEARDIDGNAIVGAGAPAISGSVNSTNLTIYNPPAIDPNQLTVQAATSGSPAVVSPATVVMRLTAVPPADTGAPALFRDVPVTIAHSALYVGTNGSIEVFYDQNTGTPNVTISGNHTTLSGGPAYGCIDSANGMMYATNGTATSVAGFASSATGNATPAVALSGASTLLQGPDGCVLDRHGNLYVANFSNLVTEYAVGSNGDAAPSTTIVGADTLLDGPSGVVLDAVGLTYVANSEDSSVTVYAPGAAGDAFPIFTITGAGTGLAAPESLAIDASGTFYVANKAHSSITEYAAGSNGDASPIATISGASTQIVGPVGVAVDASGTVYVADQFRDAILEYAPGFTGDSFPSLTIPLSSPVSSISVVPASAP